MRNNILTIAFLLAGLSFPAWSAANTYSLSSPNKTLQVGIELNEGKLSWSINKSGEDILNLSEIAIDIEGIKCDRILSAKRKAAAEMLEARVPVKYRHIRDHYNSLTLKMNGGIKVEFRAYNDGAAYRFITSGKGRVSVTGETSEWNFPAESKAYWAGERNPDYITHCEALFKEQTLGSIGTDSYSYLPLSLTTPEGTRVVITESDLRDYPNMMLRTDGKGALKAEFPHVIEEFEMRTDRDVTISRLSEHIAHTDRQRSYPWRIAIVGSDEQILESTLPWQLASPEVKADYSFLKSGKVSWEWWSSVNLFDVDFKAGINTQTYKHFIEFAAEWGLEYILLDEGWSASTLDITHPREDLNLQEIIDYGKEKGVGVVLWTLWTPMWTELESILDVYEDWGVAGIKIDFMQMQDQNMVNFYERVAAECLKRGMVVDYHGAFKPAGLQRTYPNAMTFEGVLGLEHDKDSRDISPGHDMVLPFTRMVAGPMDYTPGAVGNATADDFSILWYHPISQGTRSHQAALFVVYESPLMMICDSPSKYRQAEDYISFISRIPTIWEYTSVQEAKAGEYLIISRRTADGRWYSAALTDWTERELTLDTSFLEKGRWEVLIHRDGINADRWAEDYCLEKMTINAGEAVSLQLAKGGGWVAEFKKL